MYASKSNIHHAERVFFKGLASFQHIRLYANAVNDVTVPYPTAAIEHEDIFIDHLTKGIDMLVRAFMLSCLQN